MQPTRLCFFKINDEVRLLNPDYMTDCIGFVRKIQWTPMFKGSDHWVWRVYIKLHKTFRGLEESKGLDYVARCDYELSPGPKLSHETTSCQ